MNRHLVVAERLQLVGSTLDCARAYGLAVQRQASLLQIPAVEMSGLDLREELPGTQPGALAVGAGDGRQGPVGGRGAAHGLPRDGAAGRWAAHGIQVGPPDVHGDALAQRDIWDELLELVGSMLYMEGN